MLCLAPKHEPFNKTSIELNSVCTPFWHAIEITHRKLRDKSKDTSSDLDFQKEFVRFSL